MKKIIIILQLTFVSLAVMLTSCSDWFNLYPESETTMEDYWKDENDVKSTVGACYRAMNEGGFMERLIVWGEVRSDNVIKGPNQGNTNINRILNVALNATNGYASWYEFYRVINYCNTVIEFAPEVMDRDPNFTEGQLRAYIAEVKGIRALCYFTLVRTFRDIPFSTEPVFDDSNDLEIPQKDPDEVIQFLIDDLKSIENYAVTEFGDIEHNKGRITRNAIWALIADMSLWMNDYETCIEYCDKVLAAAGNDLVLERSAQYYYSNVFLNGNSTESIFELKFNSSLVINANVVNGLYSRVGNNAGGNDDTQQDVLSSYDFINKTSPALFETTDLRGSDFFMPIESNGRFPIIKYVGFRNRNSSGTIRASDYFNMRFQNWIFYRLPDIYLMRAEALVERNQGNDLQEALNMVSRTFERANPDLPEGFLNFNSYNTQTQIRDLVFDERQREFLFEGKRYFDLLRRIKREGSATEIVDRYLMRKYSDLDASTVRSKINDRDAIYMPIHENELKANPALKQNPFYELSSNISKN